MAYAKTYTKPVVQIDEAYKAFIENFKPSPQQAGVNDWVTNGEGNGFCDSKAGTGKTTTGVWTVWQISKREPSKNLAFVAYGKKIGDEISDKFARLGLPSNQYKGGTCHSFGYSAVRAVSKYVKLDTTGREKFGRIVAEVGIPENFYTFVKKAISFAKNRALGLYGKIEDVKEWFEIIEKYSLDEELEENDKIEDAILDCIRALKFSNEIYREIIDFDDMIYIPVLKSLKVWQYDYVLVDECQDINPARRALIRMLVKP